MFYLNPAPPGTSIGMFGEFLCLSLSSHDFATQCL